MIKEIVQDYRVIAHNIDTLIKVSGYKIKFVQEQMGMDNVSFYNKRKHAKFSIDEIEKLLDILNIDAIEDKILGELSIEAEKNESSIRLT